MCSEKSWLQPSPFSIHSHPLFSLTSSFISVCVCVYTCALFSPAFFVCVNTSAKQRLFSFLLVCYTHSSIWTSLFLLNNLSWRSFHIDREFFPILFICFGLNHSRTLMGLASSSSFLFLQFLRRVVKIILIKIIIDMGFCILFLLCVLFVLLN